MGGAMRHQRCSQRTECDTTVTARPGARVFARSSAACFAGDDPPMNAGRVRMTTIPFKTSGVRPTRLPSDEPRSRAMRMTRKLVLVLALVFGYTTRGAGQQTGSTWQRVTLELLSAMNARDTAALRRFVDAH